jgi:uncharacterized membrane protein YdjX (TVP38/TMEM64 family)
MAPIPNSQAEASAPPTEPSAARWRRFLPLTILLTGAILYFALGLNRYLTFDLLRQHREEIGGWVEIHLIAASLIYVLAYIAVVAFSLPLGTVATLCGGFLFGTLWGSTLTVVGATIGAIAVFLASRRAFGDALRRRGGPVANRLEEGLRRNAFSYLLFLRLVPLFPFWLVNIAPALFNVRLRTFAVTTLIGIIPGTVVYCSVGSGLGAVFDRGETPNLSIIFEPGILLPSLALAVLSLVPVGYNWWNRRHRERSAT